jgi:hypothetical protein
MVSVTKYEYNRDKFEVIQLQRNEFYKGVCEEKTWSVQLKNP